MSIRDLLEQGIRIQGAYQIKQYDDAFETYDILIEGDEFEEMNQVDCKDVLDMEITYMYAMPKELGYGVKIVIEVE
jgi:hypothetical protein